MLSAVTAAAGRLLHRVRPPAPYPAAPVPVLDDDVDGWPVVWLDCQGPCGRRRQAHEDHGDGTATCHTCGHQDGPDARRPRW